MTEPSGLTLIEVMVGLAILGTLLASLVVARARYLRQWAWAGRKADAVQAADQLLTRWWSNPEKFPHHGEGLLPKARLRWKTYEIGNPAASDLEARVVRLEIFEKVEVTSEMAESKGKSMPLVHVDVVLDPTKPSSSETP